MYMLFSNLITIKLCINNINAIYPLVVEALVNVIRRV